MQAGFILYLLASPAEGGVKTPGIRATIAAMITYKGLDHVAVVTKKLAEMRKFYSEALGMAVEHEGKSKAGFTVIPSASE